MLTVVCKIMKLLLHQTFPKIRMIANILTINNNTYNYRHNSTSILEGLFTLWNNFALKYTFHQNGLSPKMWRTSGAIHIREPSRPYVSKKSVSFYWFACRARRLHPFPRALFVTVYPVSGTIIGCAELFNARTLRLYRPLPRKRCCLELHHRGVLLKGVNCYLI